MDNRIIYQDASYIVDSCKLDQISGQSLLLTGSSGLFGTYILYTLQELFHRGIGPQKTYAVIHRTVPPHLAELERSEWLEFVRGDLSNDSFCNSLPRADIIIHASGYGQPGKFLEDPISALRQNTMATFALIEKMNPAGKFLYVSSGAVYAENPKTEYLEDDISFATIDHPRLCYIEGKRCGEAICELYRRGGKDIKIVRPSFTYGPGVRMDDVRVLYEFIRKAINGSITMRDSGKGIHIYEYIRDAVEEMWNVLLHGKQNVYNVAGYSEISIFDLAKQIGQVLNAEVICPPQDNTVPGAMMKQRVNSDRVEREFGKHSFVSMEEGLQRTVDWYYGNYADQLKQTGGVI